MEFLTPNQGTIIVNVEGGIMPLHKKQNFERSVGDGVEERTEWRLVIGTAAITKSLGSKGA